MARDVDSADEAVHAGLGLGVDQIEHLLCRRREISVGEFGFERHAFEEHREPALAGGEQHVGVSENEKFFFAGGRQHGFRAMGLSGETIDGDCSMYSTYSRSAVMPSRLILESISEW